MNFEEQVKAKATEINEIIEKYLPKEEGYQKTVIEAMNYSVRVGGKRIRPMLMQETFKMFDGKCKDLEFFMAAIEMIHTYSLVHDDLECMDNDEYRRGKKTTHALYGEAIAVLAGDGLLNLAAETACKPFFSTEEPELVGKALEVLFRKSGVHGMIGGQTADMEAEEMDQSKVTPEHLLFIHENKTAALIQAAMMIGGILAGMDYATVSKLEKIAYNVGLAFQIEDDILDVTSTFEELGKPIGSDEKNGKVTYVSLHGIEKSKEDVEKLSKEAIEILRTLPGENVFLEKLLMSLITRTK
jgi:geranylgeranyl diphosphate synthase type II